MREMRCEKESDERERDEKNMREKMREGDRSIQFQDERQEILIKRRGSVWVGVWLGGCLAMG